MKRPELRRRRRLRHKDRALLSATAFMLDQAKHVAGDVDGRGLVDVDELRWHLGCMRTLVDELYDELLKLARRGRA